MNIFRLQSHTVRRAARVCVPVVASVFILWLARGILKEVFGMIIGAAIFCFLAEPLAGLFEKRLNRNLSVLCAFASFVLLIAAFLLLLFPAIVSEGSQLVQTLPRSVSLIRTWVTQGRQLLTNQLPEIQLPAPSLSSEQLPALAAGTFKFAGSVADAFYRLSLMVVLSYFFLCDKERLLILLELLIPRSMRSTAVRMGNAVCRELRTYLRSQSIIAAVVGTLTAVGMSIVGLDFAIILGIIVGLLNMIPYFGPLIGAIPAVMTALSDGLQAVAMTIAILWLVQQIDNTLISPRVMSSQTGISPAIVLLSIFIGSGLGGILGMLLAMPVVMSFRTVFRVFVQRYENV